MQADRPVLALAVLRLAKDTGKGDRTHTRPTHPVVFATARVSSTRALLSTSRRNVRVTN
jgi:hypothetical protein